MCSRRLSNSCGRPLKLTVRRPRRLWLPFGSTLLVFSLFNVACAIGTLAALIFPGMRMMLPAAWRIWLWGSIGLAAANALLIAALVPLLNGIGIAHGPPPSGDLKGSIGNGLLMFGPLVASVGGTAWGSMRGYRLAVRRANVSTAV